MNISQDEYAYIIGLKKVFKEDEKIILGPAPIAWSRDIVSLDSTDSFILDFRRGLIELKKYTYNKRYRTSICLIRYCSQVRHTNPPGTDGSTFEGPHVHLYREGYDDKWAFPISVLGLDGSENMGEVLAAILNYSNIQNYPQIVDSLF